MFHQLITKIVLFSNLNTITTFLNNPLFCFEFFLKVLFSWKKKIFVNKNAIKSEILGF